MTGIQSSSGLAGPHALRFTNFTQSNMDDITRSTIPNETLKSNASHSSRSNGADSMKSERSLPPNGKKVCKL